MFDDSTICPYTGLRSFSEDESLFFKGRDKQIDQITRLLEKNKFLMVTGASGEGKSSLVYGGMIPNARAGFFKASYNNWQVIDFRPERTPLKNFASTLANKLGHQSHETVITELERGYSALIELYKNSDWFYDEDDDFWQKKSEEDKASSKRKSSNLLIIVDQFEEFFTNPENYVNSTPSESSQITLNILLETAKIALKENLPIYVVCTMRSDYIGQCSAFRGLPEAIGFSQFFVPRLKRNELKLIIEEPAFLNGNKISKRLVERLLYDLSEGIDQLPILQHALSHIWQAANKGGEELDLIHYALVGGMPSSELPEEDKPRFLKWFKDLPEFQRNLYHTPGIKRIIEIHANQLYEGAYNYYKAQNPGTSLSLHEVKNVIAITFACLTKIDDSRAVRNRMTLEEITGIINKPHITEQIVNEILNIYREQDNSFLRPFITENEQSRTLAHDAVLDITHESLIRNWGLLNKWASKEYEYYANFLDFRKQLNRWLNSGKSSGYLLPIGPLSFFEAWEEECKPNKYWIHRYEGNNGVWPDTLQEAEELLDEAHEFLRKSSKKVIVTRTFMKYGANRIATSIAIVLVIFLTAFYFIDAEKKTNGRVVETVIERGTQLLGSKDIQLDDKSDFLIMREVHQPGSLLTYLNSETNDEKSIALAINTYGRLLAFDKKTKQEIKINIISFLETKLAVHRSEAELQDYLKEITRLTTLLSYDYYYNNREATLSFLKGLNAELFERLLAGLEQGETLTPDQINRGLQFYLTFNSPSTDDINKFLNLVTPFGSDDSYARFKSLYPRDAISRNGRIGMAHNGGYHLIASLYASIGNKDLLFKSLDSLLVSNDYFKSLPFNGPSNLVGYLYQYDHTSLIEPLVNRVATLSNKTYLEVYQDVLDRSGYLKHLYSTNINANISESNAGYFGPNLIFLPSKTVSQIFADTRTLINKIKPKNERYYQLAMLNKQEVIFKHKYLFDRSLTVDIDELKEEFRNFDKYSTQIDDEYLAEEVPLQYRYYGGGLRNRTESRKHLLIYPDYIGGFFSETFHTTIFLDYLFENNKLNQLYTTSSDLQLLNYWIANANEVYSFIDEEIFKNDIELTRAQLEPIKSFISDHAAGTDIDTNLINILLANAYFKLGYVEQALSAVKLLNISSYEKTAKQFEYLNEAFFLNQVAELATNLAKIGEHRQAIEQLESFKITIFKIEAYVHAAQAIYLNSLDPVTFDLLDSAFTLREYVKEQDLRNINDYRFNLVQTLGIIGGNKNEVLINSVLKSMFEILIPFAIEIKTFGYARGGDYYSALVSIGSDLTEGGELRSYSFILWADKLRTWDEVADQQWMGVQEYYDHMLHYVFNVRGL
jgi:hypothetical protein